MTAPRRPGDSHDGPDVAPAVAPSRHPGYAGHTRADLPKGVPVYTTSRWAKGPGTFGPVGRIVCTLLLLAPIPVLALTVLIGVGIAGFGLYVLVVLPLALRHVWQKTRVAF